MSKSDVEQSLECLHSMMKDTVEIRNAMNLKIKAYARAIKDLEELGHIDLESFMDNMTKQFGD